MIFRTTPFLFFKKRMFGKIPLILTCLAVLGFFRVPAAVPQNGARRLQITLPKTTQLYWGYDYFKFDFMRAVFLESKQRFYDPAKTRLEAYQMGLDAIRRGTGPDAYISVCGGHYGCTLPACCGCSMRMDGMK